MPPKFASNSISIHWKNMKVEESLWRPSLSQVQVFNGTRTFQKLKTNQT